MGGFPFHLPTGESLPTGGASTVGGMGLLWMLLPWVIALPYFLVYLVVASTLLYHSLTRGEAGGTARSRPAASGQTPWAALAAVMAVLLIIGGSAALFGRGQPQAASESGSDQSRRWGFNLPSPFGGTREKAQTAACVNNLKQIGLAILMFAQDHNGRLPLAQEITAYADQYIKNEAVFHCPADDRAGQTSYTFNQALLGKSLSEIPNPGQTIVVFEGLAQIGPMDSAVPRHGGLVNCAFVDGHVKAMRPDELRSLTAQIPPLPSTPPSPPSLPSLPPPPSGQVTQWLEEARRLKSQGNWAGALTKVDEALRLDPNNAEGYYLRAWIELEHGAQAEAIADFRKVIQLLPPNDPQAIEAQKALRKSGGQ